MATEEERILERVRAAARNAAEGSPLSEITFDSDLREVGLHSMGRIVLLMELEEEFGVEIPDTEIDNLAPVRSLVAFLIALPARKAGGSACGS